MGQNSTTEGYAGPGGTTQQIVQPQPHTLPLTGYDIAPVAIVGFALLALGVWINRQTQRA